MKPKFSLHLVSELLIMRPNWKRKNMIWLTKKNLRSLKTIPTSGKK